jgi:hypothetical protein
MDNQSIISELTRELNKRHIGGLLGRILELIVGIICIVTGAMNLAPFQSLGELENRNTLFPLEGFFIHIAFILVGCTLISRFIYFIKWKKAIKQLENNMR